MRTFVEARDGGHRRPGGRPSRAPLTPAVLFLASAELRRRWRATVALGALAGVIAALVVGAAVLARRTSTAYDRLAGATRIDDARVYLYASDDRLVSQVAALPQVSHARIGLTGVGQLQGAPSVQYLAVQAEEADPLGLFTPVVVAGRPAAPAAADEVVVDERFAAAAGVRPGRTLTLKMLTAQEMLQFGTGFGEPDGPLLTMQVVGVARVPGPSGGMTPIIAGPAFAAAHRDALSAGRIAYLTLHGGTGAIGRLRSQVDQVAPAQSRDTPDVALPMIVQPTDTRAAARATARVLAGGLAAFAFIVALAGLLTLALAWARQHTAGAPDQRIESAVGLTKRERVAARTVAAAPAAVIASLLTIAGGAVAGRLEPLGAVRSYEPYPGWAPNVVATAIGGIVALAIVLVVAALAAARTAPHRQAREDAARPVQVRGRPWLATGVRFALDPGRGGRRLPVRSSLASVVVGIAGLVAALTFTASRDALLAAPITWGSPGDVTVADVSDRLVADLTADHRVEAATEVGAGLVRSGGRDIAAYAFRSTAGTIGWTLSSGREPTSDAEIAVGTKLAAARHLRVGSAVTIDAPDGPRRATVVGIGVGPRMLNDRLGDSVLLTPSSLASAVRAAPNREAVVKLRPGVDRGRFVAELAGRVEVTPPETPSEVRNLAELGRLPGAVGLALGAIATVALGHAIVVSTRRRGRELAVMRVLGFTPSQAAGAVVTMAATTAVLGAAIGGFVGVVSGRLVWSGVIGAIGLRIAPTVSPTMLGAVFAVAVIGAVTVAAVPAGRVSRAEPAMLLREE